MGCFPTNKIRQTDSKSFFHYQGYPSTEMGHSIKLSINPKSNEIGYKTHINRRNTKIESKYSIIKRGKLDFVNQYMVINTETNKTYIMTQITKESIENDTEFLNTIQLIIKFKSFHLINIIDSFADKVNYYIISEYFEDKNLFEKISSLAYYNESIIADIAYLLLETIDELSSSQIKHTLINPKQIYLYQDMKTKNIQIKVNALCYLEEYISLPIRDNYNMLFASPELLSSSKVDNHNLVWSIGVILYCLFIGEIPFNGVTKDEVLRNIKSKSYIKALGNSSISQKGKMFLKELLTIEHKRRIDSQTILFHPFFECLNNKDSCIQAQINEGILVKIKGIYSRMHFVQMSNAFIIDYLNMKINFTELMPTIKKLVDEKESDLLIEEVISKRLGTSMLKMKFIRVKEETLDLGINHYELIKGIIYNWYKINQKFYKQAYNELDSLNKGSVKKSDLVDLFSYSESKEIINIRKSIEEFANDALSYEEFESIVFQAIDNDDSNDNVDPNDIERKDVIREIRLNKDNENVFKNKWPFADDSFDINMMIPGKIDSDSSATSFYSSSNQ